jgi:hypothetical protein
MEARPLPLIGNRLRFNEEERKLMNSSNTKVAQGIGRIMVILLLTLAFATGCTTVSCKWAETSPDEEKSQPEQSK